MRTKKYNASEVARIADLSMAMDRIITPNGNGVPKEIKERLIAAIEVPRGFRGATAYMNIDTPVLESDARELVLAAEQPHVFCSKDAWYRSHHNKGKFWWHYIACKGAHTSEIKTTTISGKHSLCVEYPNGKYSIQHDFRCPNVQWFAVEASIAAVMSNSDVYDGLNRASFERYTAAVTAPTALHVFDGVSIGSFTRVNLTSDRRGMFTVGNVMCTFERSGHTSHIQTCMFSIGSVVLNMACSRPSHPTTRDYVAYNWLVERTIDRVCPEWERILDNVVAGDIAPVQLVDLVANVGYQFAGACYFVVFRDEIQFHDNHGHVAVIDILLGTNEYNNGLFYHLYRSMVDDSTVELTLLVEEYDYRANRQ